MQIHNFYPDPVPAIRNPLDSIVLSPHTIKPNDFSMTDIKEDCCDYQTLLPSISSCRYHDDNDCIQKKSVPRCIWIKWARFLKMRGLNKGNP
jgi:hypothetical protein